MRRDAQAVGMEEDGGAVACSNAILHCCCSIIRQAPHPGGKDDDGDWYQVGIIKPTPHNCRCGSVSSSSGCSAVSYSYLIARRQPNPNHLGRREVVDPMQCVDAVQSYTYYHVNHAFVWQKKENSGNNIRCSSKK